MKKTILFVIVMVLILPTVLVGCNPNEEEIFAREDALKAEIASDYPDKNPDDIVIPETASEEERRLLQDEKDFWAVTKKLKEIISEYIPNSYLDGEGVVSSGFVAVRRITNVYSYSVFIDELNIEKQRIAVECDILYKCSLPMTDEKVLVQEPSLYMVATENELMGNSLQDVLNYVTHKNIEVSNLGRNARGGGYWEGQRTMEKVPELKTYFNTYYILLYEEEISSGYNIELLEMEAADESDGKASGAYSAKIRLYKEDDEYFAYVSFTTSPRAFNFYTASYEQWIKFLDSPAVERGMLGGEIDIKYYPLSFEWQDCVAKYAV